MVTPKEVSKDKGNLITMISLHMGWPGVFEEVERMLEFIEVDGGMGT